MSNHALLLSDGPLLPCLLLLPILRPYWRCYYSNTDAVIYVVDSNDRDRMGISKSELVAMLEVRGPVVICNLKTKASGYHTSCCAQCSNNMTYILDMFFFFFVGWYVCFIGSATWTLLTGFLEMRRLNFHFFILRLCVLCRRKSWRRQSWWCLQTSRTWIRRWRPPRWPTLSASPPSKTESGRSSRPRPRRAWAWTRLWNGRLTKWCCPGK